MEIYDYNKALLDAIKAKLPGDTSPAWFIMDVLCISREAAYRRLRGEVPMLFEEAVLLSKKLDISLNEVAGCDNQAVRHMRMCLADFENPGPDDYNALEGYVNLLSHACEDPFSSLVISTNTLPQQLYLRYPSLSKFFLFKWAYHNETAQAKAYHRITIPERMQRILKDSLEAHRQFASTYFIFDRQIIRSLADDLRHFTSVHLVSQQEKDAICGEAHNLLNYMEQLAATGEYENGNKVYMYVSDISFERSYYNVKIFEEYVSIIETCILNGIASTDKVSYQKMEDWINSRRRLSTLITQSGEPQRIAFFTQMRSQLDEV